MQNRLRANGELGEDVAFAADRGRRDFAAGKRCMFLRNERLLGVKSRTLGTIGCVTPEGMTVIELGGLVQKAGLVGLADDDRATIFGALLELVGKAQIDVTGDTLVLWKRCGKQAFDAEEQAKKEVPSP